MCMCQLNIFRIVLLQLVFQVKIEYSYKIKNVEVGMKTITYIY